MSTLAVLALSAPVFADDLTPPTWRFNPGTTVQHWDFSAGPAGGPPDALPLNNPYGTPQLTPLPPAIWHPTMMGRNDVWDLMSTGVAAGLDFFIPNTGNSAHQKELWLQVTYWVPVPPVPIGIQVASGSGPFTQVSSTITPLPGGWFHELSIWSIPVCPASEFVHIYPTSAALYIDQVVIDTQCFIPAPGAGASLALAGMFAIRRRR
jgi:hypothetical protein